MKPGGNRVRLSCGRGCLPAVRRRDVLDAPRENCSRYRSLAWLAPRSVLLCCRCAPSPVAPAARPVPEHHAQQQGEYGRSGWRWWRKLRRRGDLPNPAEAVAAVERFLNRQHHG